jgi:hypothetical protein
MDAEAAGQPDGMAWFDAGYLAQCYAQLGISTGWKGSEPIGYDWATKGSEIRGSDASMEFALALMTVYARSSDQKWAKHADHEGHLRKAIAGAADGTLLARNLVQHFGESGKGLEHLRARYAGR